MQSLPGDINISIHGMCSLKGKSLKAVVYQIVPGPS